MSRKVIVVFMCLLVLVSSVQLLRQVVAQADVCLPLVEQAMAQVGNNCDNLNRNTACYGFNRVNAMFNEEAAANFFTQPSDTSQIERFKSIETAPLDLPQNVWGIALMRLQANLPSTLPGQATVFMLIGDSQVENAVPPEEALVTDNVVIVESQGELTMRSEPGLAGNAVAQFPANTLFSADGVSVDGTWLRASQDETWGWIERSAVAPDNAIDTLALIEPAARTPMQAFVVNTSISSLDCEDAPNLLVVQGPKDTLINLNANGADIQLGSTIVLQTTGTPPFVLDSNAPSVEVTATAFSADRSVVATGYADGSIRLWNATSGALLSTMQASAQGITDLAFVPGMDTLGVASLDGQVTLWKDGERGLVFEQPTQALSLAFSGDGATMAVGGADGSIYLWNPDTGEDVAILKGHTGAVNGLAALGSRLASAGADGSVRLWDLAAGTQQASFTGHSGAVNAVSFQPDGLRLASGGNDGIRVWHLDASGGTPDVVGGGVVTDLEYTADGSKLLSIGSDENVQLWTTDALEQRSPIRGLGAKATDIALSADGFYLVGGSEDGTSRLWRITPTNMTLAVIDGHAVVNGVTVPAGYSTSILLDESGRAIIGDWTPPRVIALQEIRPLAVVERFPDSVVNYPPELPSILVSMAATATQLAAGGGTVVAGLPTNTLTPLPTATGTVTTVPPTATTIPPTATTTPPTPTNTPLPPTPTNTPLPPSVTFGNTMWNDVNGNGVQDPVEGELSGMLINLYQTSSDLIVRKDSVDTAAKLRQAVPPYATTVTDSSGAFSFTVPEGTYYLEFFPPPGFTFGPETGINPATNTTAPFNLQVGSPPPNVRPALKQTDPNTDFESEATWSLDGHPNEPASVVQGQEFDVFLYLRNVGAQWGTGVRAQVTIPEGLSVLEGSATVGGYDSTSSTWFIGMMPTGAEALLQFRLRVVGEVDTLQVVALAYFLSNQNDDNISNNNDSLMVTIQPGSDLSLVKTVDNEFPAEGDTVVYTLTAHNAGPQADTNLTVLEELPVGVTFVSADPSVGSYDGGFWRFEDLAVGATETLTLTFTVDAGTNGTIIENVADIDGDNFDINMNDNLSGAAIDVGGEPPSEFADLSMHKTVSDTDVREGDLIHFTLEVTNTGPDDATSVVILDNLPAGVEFDHADGDGTYDEGSGAWTVGALANGAVASIDIYVRVGEGTGGTTITNAASVGSLDQEDTNGGNDASEASFSVQIPMQTADIVLSKAASVDEATAGDEITFTVAVTNDGPDNATNVVIRDSLPSSVTYVSHVASAGAFVPGTGRWTLDTLTEGDIETLTITVTINENAATTAVLNSAFVESLTQEDPNPANDSASAFVDVITVDVKIDKAVDNEQPPEGETVTFTITVGNNGPLDATGVVVTDELPEGLSFVSSSAGTFEAGTLTWDVGDVAVGDIETLTITATVDAGTGGATIVNIAEVTDLDQRDGDSINDTAAAFLQVDDDSADLSLFKFVASSEFPAVGDTVTFRLSVSNAGPSDVDDVRVRDRLPDGLIYLSHIADDGSYNPSTGVWVIGVLANNDFTGLTIRARVEPGTQGLIITNNAEILDTASLPDPDETDNSDSASITVQSVGDSADLSLEKTTFFSNPDEGDDVGFSVTIHNNGPNVATGVSVQDIFPAGLTLESAYSSNGDYDEATGIWTLSEPVPNGATATLLFEATVDGGTSGTSITNTAAILGADQDDPNPGNNDDSATLSVQDTPLLADLSVTKSNDREGETIEVGEQVNFSIEVSNNGPDNALNVQISDVLPAGLVFNSAYTSSGTYNPATGVWNIGTLSIGRSAFLSLAVSPAAGTQNTTIRNTASVLHSNQPDPDPGDNSAFADVEVGASVPENVNLYVSQDTRTNANPGDTIDVSLYMRNEGPDNATGVVVRDLLPAGLSYVSQSGSGSYDPATGDWNVGSVEAFRSVVINIQAEVTAALGSTITNTASLVAVDQTDSDASDDSNSATINIGADLSLSMTASQAAVDEGEPFEYTLTLTNNGPAVVGNISIQNTLPSTLTVVEWGGGNYRADTGMFDLFMFLNSGASGSATLTVFANPGTAGTTITSTATIAAASMDDADPGNNSASASVNVANAATSADLSIAKTVSNSSPNPDDTVYFEITVTNNGPDNATNVVVTDQHSADMTYYNAFPSDGSTYDSATGVWTIPALLSGDSKTLPFYALVNEGTAAGTTITNTATVAADQDDVTLENNSASTTITVATNADIALSMAASSAEPLAGSQVTFEISASNNGVDTATNLQMRVELPQGLSYVSHNGDGRYDTQTSIWTLDTLANGVTAKLYLTVGIDSSLEDAALTNRVQVIALDQNDPVLGNNVGIVTITVTPLEPTEVPEATVEATDEVTDEPTLEPTVEVTSEPTSVPTEEVTGEVPTSAPTIEPTTAVTAPPSDTPTDAPTEVASITPTDAPTDDTGSATAVSTATRTPTASPTAVPTTPAPEATESAAAKRRTAGIFALASVSMLLSLPLVARRKRE